MTKVAIVGMGKMGSAIAQVLDASYELIKLDQADDISLVQPAGIIILAVKPQSFSGLANELKPYIQNQTILSIMAGVDTQQISSKLGTTNVARSMPNLGLLKASSLTALYANELEDKPAVDALVSCWGKVIWLNQETDFDVFTALAGSGPAYIFELVAQIQQSAEKLGMNQTMAQEIAAANLQSAAAVLEEGPARDRVMQIASKGGTTEAALRVFEQHNFAGIVYEAIRAAAQRSKELSDEIG